MKTVLITLLSILSCLIVNAQETKITGTVTDAKGEPLAFVNVFIEGTLDGGSTDINGIFDFETYETGTVTFKASFIGFDTYSQTGDVSTMKNLKIKLGETSKVLDDVVVVAGNYSLKSSPTMQKANVIDLLTMGGSDGDLYRSLSIIPGTQVGGSDGRLVVRGGSSRESQTYIDGMHVMSPYVTTEGGITARGRYAPFLFEGINFSTGGYSSEYSQSLSSVLPLTTKDKSNTTKLGVILLNVYAGGGGTKAWNGGSASFDLVYTDVSFYNEVFDRKERQYVDLPFKDLAIQNQLRFDIGKRGVLKTYFAFANSWFRSIDKVPFTDQPKNMNYRENNVYLNSTYQDQTASGVKFFAGAAYSWNRKNMCNYQLPGDNVYPKETEFHLKTKVSKRFTNLYRLEAGAESYMKSYFMRYNLAPNSFHQSVDNDITGAFVSNDFNINSDLFLNASVRGEYGSLNEKVAVLPRVALTYQSNGFTISGIFGKYQQAAEYEYLFVNNQLAMESNLQTMLALYYEKKDRIYRLELYNKKYNDLPLLVGEELLSKGNGYSRGIDMFFNDRNVFKYFEYMISYSYNDSKRKYLGYSEKVVPDFVRKHNASVMLKFTNLDWKTIFSVTNHFASGRYYNNPNISNTVNSRSPFYHTLDISLTYLADKKVIIYGCISNLLNRTNINGYKYSPIPGSNGQYASMIDAKMHHNQTFYVGVFITLGKNVAYDVSNF